MSRMRVMELAKEVGLDNKATIAKLAEIGIQVTNHFNAISDDEAERFRSYVKTGKSSVSAAKESSSKDGASKVIIRRRSTTKSDDEQSAASANETSEKPKVIIRRRGDAPAEDARETAPRPATAEQPERSVEPETAKPLAVPTPTEITASEPAKTPSEEAPAKEPKVEFTSAPKSSPAAESLTMAASQTSEPVKTSPLSVAASTAAPSTSSPSDGATIVRRAPKDTGAVVIRRGSPSETPNSFQRRPSYNDDSSGGYNRRPSYGDDSSGGYNRRPNYGDDSQGGFNRRPNQGDDSSGGFNRRPGFGDNAGGYPRRDGQGDNFNREARGPYVSRPGDRGPSDRGGPGRPGQQGPGQNSGRPFPNRPGGPSGGPGGRPMGGPPRGPRPGSSDTGLGIIPSADELTPTRERRDRDRDRDKRRVNEEESIKRLKTKQNQDDVVFIDEEEAEAAGVRNFIPQRRRAGGKKQKDSHRLKEQANPMKASKRVVRIEDTITVGSLAQEMSVKSSAVIKSLMSLGVLATVNQSLDNDTATLVAQEFGFEVQNVAKSIGDILGRDGHSKSEEEGFELVDRAPVVTIMGHVDHGKTSLLDAIRKSNKTESEAGGITQHIGAYRVDRDGRPVTFIDTPGHAAFTEMRARGAKVTDVVILVVAADDGVMPQTVEAISHAKAAGVPIVVAVNKIDKPSANYDRILSEMASHDVSPEEWGGDAMFVKVSAVTKEGIGELLDAVLLQAEVLDLKARKDGMAEGVVIESRLDKARGPVATFLVNKGTLRVGDSIVAGKCAGRVRALFDDAGNPLNEVIPSVPVEVLGLDSAPSAGDSFNVVANDSVARQAVEYRIDKDRRARAAAAAKTNIQDLLAQLGSGQGEKKELPLIIKADTHGSVEAIRSSLEKLGTDKVQCKVVHAAVGGITETDVTLASAANAIVIGFNVRPDKKSTEAAEGHGVEVQTFSIIYELIESVERAMAGKLDPIRHERVQGRAEVRETFSVPKVGTIAGCGVTDGKIIRNGHIRVVRDGIVLFTGRIGSLRRFKDDAKEVAQGYECGIGVDNYNDLKVGDVLECFIIEEVAATLRPAGSSESHSSRSEESQQT